MDEIVATGPFFELDLAKTLKMYEVKGLRSDTSKVLVVAATE